MGVLSTLAPPLLRRHGSRLAIEGSLLLIGAVGVGRALVAGAALVLLLTVPIGVGLPSPGRCCRSSVQGEHPDRPTLGTGVYTAGINVAAMLASVLEVPIAPSPVGAAPSPRTRPRHSSQSSRGSAGGTRPRAAASSAAA